MRAVVLVGGEGTRLRPLTYTTPKQLLPVAEVTVIERVVGHLAAHGIVDVVLSMGYLPDAFHVAFPGDRCAGATLIYAVEPSPLDTAGAIAFAARTVGIADPFVVVNGDVVTDLDLGALIAFHHDRAAQATIHLTEVDDPSAFGVVPTDERGRVLAFIEKPPRGEAPTPFVNAGTYVLEPAVVERITPDIRVSIERDVFPAMVAEGVLYAMATDDYWIDTGTPAMYLAANLDKLAATPPAPGAVERTPGVWCLGAAVIDGELVAPVLIGDAALIAAGAEVHRAVVGAGARVLEGAVVHDSVLLPGAVVRAGGVVRDSVVGEGAIVGEGAEVGCHSVVGSGAEVEAGARLVGERLPA